VPLRGNSTEALRAYLSTVEEIKPKRFEVQWNPATVAIDKVAALRSLRAVSRDGSTLTFASDEPALAKLKPGSILWVWDIAVRKVDSVETFGGVTHVHTSVVTLTEAMPNARIEFEAPVKLQNYYPQRKVEPPEPAAARRPRLPGLGTFCSPSPRPRAAGQQRSERCRRAFCPSRLPQVVTTMIGTTRAECRSFHGTRTAGPTRSATGCAGGSRSAAGPKG
jgi:hypothetical protein